MTQLNDEVVRVTGGPTYNEGLASWFGKTDDEALQDAERRWLIAQGGTPGTNQDMWIEVFGPGQINDVKLDYWSGQDRPVPDIVGLSLVVATDLIVANGFILGTPVGTVDPVLSQVPLAGVSAAAGSAVTPTMTA